jgi:hypothetical protein
MGRTRGFESKDAGAADSEGLSPRLLGRLAPEWAQRLHEAVELLAQAASARDPSLARQKIRHAHAACVRVDSSRVHPSWWVRALREESPAAQRAVAATAPVPVRHAVQAGLLLDSRDLSGDHDVSPEVSEWITAVWSERLVGGEPMRGGDPPVMVALTGISLLAGYRLCRCAGLAKLAMAERAQPRTESAPSVGRSPAAWFRDQLASANPSFAALASSDVRANPTTKWPKRRHAARLGLVTIARLLGDCEPFRVRWALQHWPYPIAKLARSLIPGPAQRSALVSRGESLVLQTAWQRLNLEGRLATLWPVASPLMHQGEAGSLLQPQQGVPGDLSRVRTTFRAE